MKYHLFSQRDLCKAWKGCYNSASEPWVCHQFCKINTCTHTRAGISGNDCELSYIKFPSPTKENCDHQGKSFWLYSKQKFSFSRRNLPAHMNVQCNPTGSSRSSTTLQKYSTLYDSAHETIRSSKELNLKQADSTEFSVTLAAEIVDSFSSRCFTKVNKSSPSRLYFVCRRQQKGSGVYLDLLKVYKR